MPGLSWGAFPSNISERTVITESTVIEPGKMAWVANVSQLEYDSVYDLDWETFLQGDISLVKTEIERQVPGTAVQWVRCYWDRTEKVLARWDIIQWRWVYYYHVYGFRMEAIVKNISPVAGTLFEFTASIIIAIAIAVGFIALVIAAIALGVWLVLQIVGAAGRVGGDWGIILVSLVLLGGGAYLILRGFGIGLPGLKYLTKEKKGKGKK